jgi:type II secretory pathway predicted ATPase ExeA
MTFLAEVGILMNNINLRTSRKPETEAFLSKTIRHPMFQNAFAAMAGAHRTHGNRSKGVMLLGPSGVGKTTVIENYARTVSRSATETHSYCTVLHINTPPSATIKDVLSELLFALNDPAPDKGTERAMNQRFRKLAKELQVELIVLDEVQHLLKHNAQKDTRTVSNFIKNLMSDLQIPVVLCGLEEASQIGSGHAEFKRRFAATCLLSPFGIITDEERNYFTQYLVNCEKVLLSLGVKTVSLTSELMIDRFYLASQGKPALISALIEQALENAELGETLTVTDYAKAWAFAIHDPFEHRVSNPFHMRGDSLKLHTAKGSA